MLLQGVTNFSFSVKGKRTAWEIWNVFPEITDTFIALIDNHNIPMWTQVWSHWTDLSFSSMIKQAPNTMWMRQELTCFHKKAGMPIVFLQHKVVFFSIERELSIRLDIAWAKSLERYCCRDMGRFMEQPSWRKQSAEGFYVVIAQKSAVQTASAKKWH